MPVTVSTPSRLTACLAAAVFLAGASAFVATSEADHVHADAAALDGLRLDACAGGRAFCGDRSGAVPPEAAETESYGTDATGCAGGRRACGDRIPVATKALPRTAPADGTDGDHPRALGR